MIRIHPYIEVLDTTDTDITESLIEQWRKSTDATIRLFYEFFDDEDLFLIRSYILEDEHFSELDSLFRYMCENSELSMRLNWDDVAPEVTDFKLQYLERPTGIREPVPEDRFNF
ncbi:MULTISPECIES: hypothetical protein [Corynebacterium]|uniref:Uncharacterized protein n=2 Tax=Corynebacterium TaxID=1716 RepID=A0A3G6IZJ1_9CORY|nr:MULTISPECIES: hypothetical protein [Corynebacterium]AZA10933.1 hypothetical protein CGERO_03050 [Corynebacterium gerontici]QAU52866.1 hypothetical protein CPELA_08050 [Corynebacterium pelargi]GGG76421.1 hypothetical protein GCM10007338_12700 [Corynebacterium pelargi]